MEFPHCTTPKSLNLRSVAARPYIGSCLITLGMPNRPACAAGITPMRLPAQAPMKRFYQYFFPAESGCRESLLPAVAPTARNERCCPRCTSYIVQSRHIDVGVDARSWIACNDHRVGSAITLTCSSRQQVSLAVLSIADVGSRGWLLAPLVQNAVRTCREDGYLKIIAEDDMTCEILCELLTGCGLHAPQRRVCRGRQLHEFYLDL